MRTIGDLVRSADGRAYLEEQGVALSRDDFVARLASPVADGVTKLLEEDDSLIYSAHQLQSDYAPSVTAKLRALRDAATGGAAIPVAVWLDMDRIGSNKLSGAIVWPSGGQSVRLVSRRAKEMEPRFAPVERERLEQVVAELEVWARAADGNDADERHQRLAEAILSAESPTLAQVNLAITSLVVRDQIGLDAHPVLVSDLAAKRVLEPPLNAALTDLPGLVAVFNAAVDALLSTDVDPQVRHLDEDYLPLRYSCPNDGVRSSLRHRVEGSDHVAVARCSSCGTEHRFHLGSTALSADEVTITGRWSPDVTLPALLNDLFSGVVVGQSSGLYGLVLNELVSKVLGGTPIPMLVPENLGKVLAEEAPGSLVYDYLTGA